MPLNELIYKRKSCRSYTSVPVSDEMLANIKAFSMKPLYPEIGVHWEIVPGKQVQSICPWKTPQLIAIYSEKKDGWLENAGFLFQQMDLYLQSLGLGACWLGLGRMKPKTAPKIEGMDFVILLAFGHPKGDNLRDIGEFKRKDLEKIADRPDPQLEPARLAPSAINSQPWYFVHGEDEIHAYCVRNGRPGYMNQIDMGIALAHLYVTNPETFRFCQRENPPTVPNYTYTGTIILHTAER